MSKLESALSHRTPCPSIDSKFLAQERSPSYPDLLLSHYKSFLFQPRRSQSSLHRNLSVSSNRNLKPRRPPKHCLLGCSLRLDNPNKSHLLQVFQSLSFLKTLPQIDPSRIREKMINLPKTTRKTLIFDLDETLVHCPDDLLQPTEAVFPVRMPDNTLCRAGINVRPFARECLQQASSLFEVIIFTASQQPYADAVINFLDPSRKLVQHRLYRDSCLQINGVFIKDLRVLKGRRFKDMALVDNYVHSFGHQIDNGIPITSWEGDKDDRELEYLIDYLPILFKASDIRDANRQNFNLNEFYHQYSSLSYN